MTVENDSLTKIMECKTCKQAHAPHELRDGKCLKCTAEELERVQKQAAAMREALKSLIGLCDGDLTRHPGVERKALHEHRTYGAGICRGLIIAENIARAALSPTAGDGYVSKEAVRPLVETTTALLESIEYPPPGAGQVAPSGDGVRRKKARVPFSV